MLEDILEGLNDRQREAVLHFGTPLLVLAGAGSGKTKVITHKIMYLTDELGIDISRILAITFTNKAANEMKDRVERYLGRKPPWVMTFHSLATKILRVEANHLGLNKNFVIYDEEDSKKIIKKVLKDLNLSQESLKPEKLKDIISKAKQEDDPAEIIDFYSLTTPPIKQVYQKYEEELKNSNALDFDDLILKTVSLFSENIEILEKWQSRFDYILVDEYQDTNKIQHWLLKLLVGKRDNLTVVGDPAQCIYTWRGATPENILEFEKDFPNTKIVKLERNYRSTKNILDCANAVISKSSGRWQKKVLKLWTDKEQGEDIFLKALLTDKEEADFIAKKILEKNQDYSQFAVLVRMSFLTRNIEESMLRYGIPYQIIGGLRFYERAEVKDILSYIRVSLNPKDFASFERSITTPSRGIGEKGFEYIKSNYRLDWLQALRDSADKLSSKAKDGIYSYLDTVNYIRENIEKDPVYTLKEVLKWIDYESYLQREYNKDWEDRLQNIQELITALEEAIKSGKTVNDFLEESSLTQAQDTIEEDRTVKIMTIHASKGLEFKTVFVVGLEEGIFPSSRAFEDVSQMEEERRLFYVAITRAKQELYLTFSKTRHSFSKKSLQTTPSRFLKDIKEFLNTLSEKRSVLKENKYHIEDNSFKVGQLVKHELFGKGVIKSITKNRAVIIFEKTGEKTIDLSFVKPA